MNQTSNKKQKIAVAILLVIIAAVSLARFYKNKKQAEEMTKANNEIVKNPDNVATVQIANHEMVQVRFSWEKDGIKYNDALNILKSEYGKLTAEQIEKMKQERFDNWVKLVNEQSRK
jgi:hypothetical protein